MLTIAVPAYNRPAGLDHLLRSLNLGDLQQLAARLDVVVCDDSTNDRVEHVVMKWASALSSVEVRYYKNPENLGMARNWNNCVSMARGDYVLILHDDDYLLPGAIARIIHHLDCFSAPVNLFGVRVVDGKGRILRRQTPARHQILTPIEGILLLSSNSSAVRFPGLVVHRDAYSKAGFFDPDIGYPADLDMWVRLVALNGLSVFPEDTAAYTVHPGALTNRMFTRATVDDIEEIFDRIWSLDLLSDHQFSTARANFFHQFLLAGAIRSIRGGRWREAHQVSDLLKAIEFDAEPKVLFRVLRRVLALNPLG